MGYTIDATESGCYPGTTVLVNKFDLRSQSELDADELMIALMIATIYAAQGIDLPLKDVLDKIIKE